MKTDLKVNDKVRYEGADAFVASFSAIDSNIVYLKPTKRSTRTIGAFLALVKKA